MQQYFSILCFWFTVADKIIFLDEGKIVEENTPDDFFRQPKTERAGKFLNTFKFEFKEERGKGEK